MNYIHSTVDFAGIAVDSFLVDGEAYVTLSSLAMGLQSSRQSVKNWGERHNKSEGVAVRVGQKQVHARAYPVSVACDFVEYRASVGDKNAKALISATFRADFERTIKEANGIRVTAAQHEENRANIRYELVNRIVELKAEVNRLSEAVIAAEDDSVSVEVYYETRAAYDEVNRIYQEAKGRRDLTLAECQAVAELNPDISI